MMNEVRHICVPPLSICSWSVLYLQSRRYECRFADGGDSLVYVTCSLDPPSSLSAMTAARFFATLLHRYLSNRRQIRLR
jgi:hypothetical protein